MIHIASCPECDKEIAATDALLPDEESLLRCPHCEAEFSSERLTLREVPELIVARGATGDGEASAQSLDGELELEEPEIVAPTSSELPQDEGPEAQSPIDMPVVTSRTRREFDGIETLGRSSRSSSGPSFLRQLVGIIGGGIVGLAIGYFILLWIGGPGRDFLKIGRHMPRWAVPAAFHPDIADFQDGEPGDRQDGGRSLAEPLEDSPEFAADDIQTELEGLPPVPELEPADDLSTTEPTVEEVLVRNPPELGTANLQAALETAVDARLALVAGELSDSTLKPTKEVAYQAFAALAEAFTFAKPTQGREAEHEQLRADAERLLRETLATERMTAQLGPLAAEWFDSPSREHGGFVSAGVAVHTHLGIRHQPGVALQVAGTRTHVMVVGPSSIDVPLGSQVLVVGSLVDRPQERIAGYTGSARQVVWASLVEPIGE